MTDGFHIFRITLTKNDEGTLDLLWTSPHATTTQNNEHLELCGIDALSEHELVVALLVGNSLVWFTTGFCIKHFFTYGGFT